MQIAIVLSALVALSFASPSKRIVCTDDICGDQKVLDCKGGVITTGFCGCTQYCAKQKGESCQMPKTGPFLNLFGVIETEMEKCDTGLKCTSVNLEGHATPVCSDLSDNEDVLMSKRQEMVCPPNVCDSVKKEVLNCKGGLLEGAGWCGCTDLCAKTHGESCIPEDSPFLLMDVANTETCDEDLVCHKAYEGSAICLRANETSTFVSKRSSKLE